MGATDQMLARYVAEIEERQQFIDGIVAAADGKDLSDEQAELVTATRNRIERGEREDEAAAGGPPHQRRLAERIAQLAKYMGNERQQAEGGRVPVSRRLPDRLLAGPARQRAKPPTGSTPTTGPPPTSSPPTAPASSPSRSSARSSTSSTPPARSCRRSGRGRCRRRRGHGRRSRSTPASPNSQRRRPSSPVAEDGHRRGHRHRPDVRRLRQRRQAID